ncbi:MAG: hypothetical protein H0X26_00650 [Alphaproteobacteria bacterium]|nr:hypothetical protein [Alphaproteobacteria bacterium]
MTPPTFADIDQARLLLKGVVLKTPTLYSPSLSKMLQTKIFKKPPPSRTEGLMSS